MAYFPMFVDMTKYNILIIGGGRIAYEKYNILIQFCQNITVLAKEFDEKLDFKDAKLITKAFEPKDIECFNFDLVVSAINDINLHKEIYNICRAKRIHINCVDFIEYCTFTFGAIVTKEDLVIGISTSSLAPCVSKGLKKIIHDALPKDILNLIHTISNIRTNMPKGTSRMNAIKDICQKFFAQN